MAISVNSLTGSYNITDATSFTTSTISITANALVLVAVLSSASTPANVPTLTGNSLTYVQVSTLTLTGNNRTISLFRALGASPSSGGITMDFAGQSQSRCLWSVAEFTGVDTSGTNGSGAIVQHVESADSLATATSKTINLAALASANNMAYGAMWHFFNELVTPGSGFTEIHDMDPGESTQNLQTQYKLNETAISWSWASTVASACLGVEIAAATATPTGKHRFFEVF